MSAKEKAVRDAAAALHHAIDQARKAGLVVVWPSSPDGLPGIAINETSKAVSDATVTVVAKGVEPGSAEHTKATQAAQKAVNGDTPAKK